MERTDLTNLRNLGEAHAHDWAGANEAIAAGLVEWTRAAVVHDHRTAVHASLDACKLVLKHYPQSGGSPRKYIDNMVAVIQRWVDEPTRENQEVVRGALDYTRAVHAWQTPTDSIAFWILESVDHACLTVWAGERASYIIPVDFATTAGRVMACVYRALRTNGASETEAANAVLDCVLAVTG